MNIEIYQLKLEALIQQRMASGRFQSIEDVLVQALESALLPQELNQERTGAELIEACAKVRGLLTDEEVDMLFIRTPSFSRPVDFE